VLLAAWSVSLPVARGEEAPPAGQPLQVVPRAEGLTLDGRPDEEAWKTALRLPADSFEAPPPPPGTKRVTLTPDVRALESGGRLWLAVSLAEDPGMGMGLRVMAGPDTLASAADAVSLGYAPQEMRAARYSVRGPRGATRATGYAAEGAADWSRLGAWSLELALPIEALDLGGPGAALRLALAVTSRTSNLVAAVPVGGLFSAPAAWLRLGPAAGAWSTGPAPDLAALAAADAQDEERLAAWREFQTASHEGPPAASPEEQRRALEGRLLGPLEQIARLRPDLKAWVGWIRGDVAQRLGLAELAERSYREALEAMPGCREAAFQLHVKLLSQALTEGPASAPTDFEAALARLAGAATAPQTPYEREGAALARALLLYKRGDFGEAAELFVPLAARYPSEALITLHLERARAAVEDWARELQRRAADDAKGDLPRVTLSTSKGDVTLELFEDDAPNAVKNLVWLVEHGFYDGTTFHRNDPYFVLQGGDPFTKEGAEARWIGGGGPGYAIPTEPSSRRAFRGTVALLGASKDAEAASSCWSGSAASPGSVSVVGRLVAGQAAADALVEGERLVKAVVTRRRPSTTYRPLTVAGAPAPEPVATPPPR
jgi:peptidyl-prolyl cis-trans isomerase B (cyclophilin B)